MNGNTFGAHFRMHSFGESHGVAMGVIVDGCPAGVRWDTELLLQELARRRPGQKTESGANVVSARNESDQPEILSGVHEGKTLGTPIAMIIKNQDARSQDYADLGVRPGHADDMWKLKYEHVDLRGGGRSSGRETVARVLAGSVAQMFLRQAAPELRVQGWVESVAHLQQGREPSTQQKQALEELLLQAKQEGKSYGGIAALCVQGLPAGLGQPVFHKLKADLAMACMSVGATSGFELGAGFAAAQAEGSVFHQGENTEGSYGGIRGGISTGEDLTFRVAFKPTSSVLDIAKKGRHDPCIVPRAVPVLEAMTYLVLADHLLARRLDR